MPMDVEGFKPVKSKSPRRKRRTTPFKKQNKADSAAHAGWGQSFQVEQGNQDWSGWEDPLPKPEYSKGWEYQTRVDRLRDVIPFWRDGVYAALEGRDVPKMEEFLDRVYTEDVWGMNADAWGVKVDDPWATGDDWNNLGNGWKNAGGWGSQADRPASNGWNEGGAGQGDGGWENGDNWENAGVDGWGTSKEAENAGWELEQPRAVLHHSADEWAMAGDLGKHGSDKTEDAPHAAEGADPNSFVDQIARLERVNGKKKEQMHQFYSMPTHVKVQKIEEMARSLRELR
ncbi:hypothetical protein PHLGIDRAFT_123953 [Phlebiopsis gigantea 11061_1 CR5-6]|uniref:Uncharacterized protein n=1 Tax=Phlebiopsis gigantea (strain 11061_1 CR5-6) TaxID=745531 RepID=A0A0C3S7G0_PHLG1|nr:hypothetical protein PHLGIDRAFT_123953 [Phlebiopsis gigantea 11061_1 CR5-6]